MTSEAGPPPAIVLRDVTLGYGGRPAVHHLSGTVRAGALLAVVGPNGAGKSTLLKGVAGEIAPLDGAIALGGIDRHGLAYLPQRAEIDLSFPIGVGDFVATGLWRRLGPWRRAGTRERHAVRDAIAAVGLSGFERRPIGTLSGGQVQRTLFARAIVQDSPLILLDEPFTAVDEATAGALLDVVAGWHRDGRTVLAALHDLGQVRAHFPETLILARDAIAWGPTPSVLTPGNLARCRGLAEAWSEVAAPCTGAGKTAEGNTASARSAA